jgi:probable DNA metabolism protein
VIRPVALASAVDFDGFRRACRQLWAEQVAPEHVSWHTADDAEGDLFDAGDPGAVASSVANAPSTPGDASVPPPVNAPAAFMALAESVVLHSDPGRFGLLYRLLWRLQVEPGLRRNPLDADWVEAEHLAQAVRSDMHRMRDGVRFRAIADGADPGQALHVAWFEPEHHIVEATAPFFARRHAAMHWAILTPERSVRWDGASVVLGAKARRDQAPPGEAGDALWLAYCQSLFDTTRVTLKTMPKDEPKRRLPAAVPQPTPGHATTPGGEAPRSLPALRDALERCRECPIGEHATQAVPGEGPARARLMFVGEQPGDQEDLQGRPFVGPAGQLFARALEELGIDRKDVYITNAVKHFKFELRGKRRIHKTPAQEEAAACLHWLESEIGLVDPEALIALGATAARQLLGRAVAVTRERGHWLKRGDGRRVLIMLHPSALLRMEPEDKAEAYRAWLADLRHVAPRPPSDGSERERL